MHHSEFEEAYEDDLRPDDEFLNLPIRQLQPRKAVMVSCDATVGDAVHAMNVNHTGCVLVEHDGRLVGIFTERDVLTKVFGCEQAADLPVESVMTRDPETLELKDDLAFAMHHMSVGGYRNIPILEEGRPVAVLSVRDVVHYLADRDPEGVMNLPPTPGSAIYRTVDGG